MDRILRIIGLSVLVSSFIYWVYCIVNQTPEEYEDIKRKLEEEENHD